jgi:hypothetical protein
MQNNKAFRCPETKEDGKTTKWNRKRKNFGRNHKRFSCSSFFQRISGSIEQPSSIKFVIKLIGLFNESPSLKTVGAIKFFAFFTTTGCYLVTVV